MIQTKKASAIARNDVIINIGKVKDVFVCQEDHRITIELISVVAETITVNPDLVFLLDSKFGW